MIKSHFLNAKNSIFNLEKDFIELKTELKDREIKIKKEIEELIIEPIIVWIEDTERPEEEMKKQIRSVNYTWHGYWLDN